VLCRGGGASRRFSAALRSDRARVFGGATGNAANFVSRAPAPTSSFILALRDGGPHAIGLAVRPRSGRVTDSGSVVGPIRDEIKLTFSPLISTHLLTSYVRFHSDQCIEQHRACLVLTVITVGLTATTHFSV
jgi:hypothetical protein